MNDKQIAYLLREAAAKSVPVNDSFRTLAGVNQLYSFVYRDISGIVTLLPDQHPVKLRLNFLLGQFNAPSSDFGQLLYCVVNLREGVKGIADELDPQEAL